MSVSNISNENFKFMMASSVAFMQNKETEGKVCFEAAPAEQRNKVFQQLWINRGCPISNPKYGEHAFRNQCGLSSSNLEKCHAIDKYISSCLMKNDPNDMRLQARGIKEFHDKIDKDHKFHKDMWDNRENFDKICDKASPIPDHHEKLVQGVVVGAAAFATAVFVADGIRKAMGH